MVSKAKVCLLGLGAATLATAAIVANRIDVTLAGKPLRLDAVTVGGRTYVALDQLKAGLNAAGGANAIKATEGVVGDVLFDGVWRLTVLGVKRSADGVSWEVKVRVGNGTAKTRSMDGAVNNFAPHTAFHVATEAGDTLTAPAWDASPLQRELTMKDLLPGSSASATVHFVGPADDKPVKFILEIKPTPGLPYVKDPSFRVDLTRGKDG